MTCGSPALGRPPSWVRRAALPFRAVGEPGARERDAAWAPVWSPDTSPGTAHVIQELFIRLQARAALPGMLAVIGGWRPDVVVRETCEFSSAVAAERLDVPQAQIGIHQSSLTDAADWLIALAAGVPLALIPLLVDGPANARRVAEIGAGIELAGTSGLADAVERLVGYPRYREAAGRVADEIRTLPPVDGAVDDIVATARRRELAA